MSNAIKFSSRGGTVAISARRAEGWLELDVADSGPGIATEDIAHIFDPFYQGRNNAVGLVQGTGIGLSVVKEYIAAHGGSVEVADHGGSGALLRVRLPLDQSQVGA
jgi:two-component system sensor histidine kinase GlrK